MKSTRNDLYVKSPTTGSTTTQNKIAPLLKEPSIRVCPAIAFDEHLIPTRGR